MVKFEIWLADNDFDRLFEIKKQQGKTDLTGNEFARELLESQLHRLHPQTVKFDDDGNAI